MTFIGPCILIYSYTITNQMHRFHTFILSYTPHVLDGLPVHHQELKTLHISTGICQTANASGKLVPVQSRSRQQEGISKTATASGNEMELLPVPSTSSQQKGSSSCLTYTCCCIYSLQLLMMGGKTVRNMWSVTQNK